MRIFDREWNGVDWLLEYMYNAQWHAESFGERCGVRERVLRCRAEIDRHQDCVEVRCHCCPLSLNRNPFRRFVLATQIGIATGGPRAEASVAPCSVCVHSPASRSGTVVRSRIDCHRLPAESTEQLDDTALSMSSNVNRRVAANQPEPRCRRTKTPGLQYLVLNTDSEVPSRNVLRLSQGEIRVWRAWSLTRSRPLYHAGHSDVTQPYGGSPARREDESVEELPRAASGQAAFGAS